MKNALNELLPRKARLGLYVVVTVGALGVAAWQAAEGNWLVFAGSLFGSLTTLLAAGNTPGPDEEG